jgi:serine/threonine protein kinase
MSLCATLGFTIMLANAKDVTQGTKLPVSMRSFQAPGRIRKLPVKLSSQPRVVFWQQGTAIYAPQPRMVQDDETLHAPPGEEAAWNRHVDDPQDGCVPMADWQSKSFPNCNSVHELDLRSAGPNVGVDETVGFEDTLAFLGQGWFRQAWQLDHGDLGESVVLKTLRLERDFLEEYYDLHRRDALAMERLTHSPFVMDVYGFCGQSALNELADFPHGLNSLEKFDRNLRDHHGPDVLLLKLQVAASVAVGLAHVHEIDSNDGATMVHYDLNPRNVAIVKSGMPKLNDFNIGVFLRVHPETNETCGFPSRLHEPWWRAPEEVEIGNNNSLSEKVDVYALGNLLFHILTTRSPRGKMKAERMQETRELVLRGEAPITPEPFDKNNDSVTKVFRKAMKMCFEVDPAKRASARQVANMLMTTLKEAKAKARKKREKKGLGSHVII